MKLPSVPPGSALAESSRPSMPQPRRRSYALSAGSALVLLVVVSCAERENVFLEQPDGPPIGFVDPDAGGADVQQVDANAPNLLLCPGTECPAPYTTCPETPSHVCGTNLMNDPQNCGGCGVSCNSFVDGLKMAGSCVNGECAYVCVVDVGSGDGPLLFRDCNNVLDDGCEVDVYHDAENCGTCGHRCAPGVRCIGGQCGCSIGKIDCNGKCVDPRFDDNNCKTCGNACEVPAGACTNMPPNTVYGCADAECGRLKCQGSYQDCNGDLSSGCASDGCETDTTDRNNCGGCGIQCLPGQECSYDDSGQLGCRDACGKDGRVKCGGSCRDLLTDRFNCGMCGLGCEGRANEVSACKKGLCVTECRPGFADCNGDRSDGCEVDVNSDPSNCGACGHECDLAAGQPCIEGKCLMVECEPGGETK